MEECTITTLEGLELTFEHDLHEVMLAGLLRLIDNRPYELAKTTINLYGGKVVCLV